MVRDFDLDELDLAALELGEPTSEQLNYAALAPLVVGFSLGLGLGVVFAKLMRRWLGTI